MAYNPPQIQRVRGDVIEVGTAQIAGVTARIWSGSRVPYNGAYTSTLWANSTFYALNTPILLNGQSYVCVQGHTSSLGVNDPESDTYSSGMGTFWRLVDGKDGDLWLAVTGSTSDLYVKAGDIWSNTAGSLLATTLADNGTGTALSYDAAVLSSAEIKYSIVRGSNIRSGMLKVVNNGTVGVAGASLSEVNIVEIGAGDVGVTFGAQVNGSGRVEITYVTDSQGSPASLKYQVKGWGV